MYQPSNTAIFTFITLSFGAIISLLAFQPESFMLLGGLAIALGVFMIVKQVIS